MSEHVILYSTFPSLEEAKKIADDVVSKRLAACVNLFPSIVSVYEWNNQMNHDQEVAAFFKTHISQVDVLMQVIKNMHSYDLPALIQIPITSGDLNYLEWISKTVLK